MSCNPIVGAVDVEGVVVRFGFFEGGLVCGGLMKGCFVSGCVVMGGHAVRVVRCVCVGLCVGFRSLRMRRVVVCCR